MTLHRTLPLAAEVGCFVAAILCMTVSASAAPDRAALIAMGQKPGPPTMFKRAIPPPTTQPAGEQIDIIDGDQKFVLYVPAGYRVPENGNIDLCLHFHAAVWFAIQEHLRRGLTGPLLIGYLGEGSAVYGKPFKDRERLARLFELVENELSIRAATQPSGDATKPGKRLVHVTTFDITSFSAGYGAVREIIQNDAYVAMIRRIILCDSLYAGWDPATTQPGATSQPALENMQPFEKFARLAANGEKTFLLVHSSVPTPYANTQATAKWLAELVDAPRIEIAPNSSPASSDPDFPLLYRADLGHLHLWGYGGTDAQAHMTHVRHLADVWKALDACGDR